MTPQEIYLARLQQYGSTEQANEPRAEAAQAMSQQMKKMLGQRNLVKSRSDSLKRTLEAKRQQKARISYEGT